MFQTERLTIRPMVRADLEQNLQWMNDPELQYLFLRPPKKLSMEEELQWFEGVSGDTRKIVLSLVESASGLYIGNLGFSEIDRMNHSAALWIYIGDASYWGCGLATEATRALVSHGFFELQLHQIYLRVGLHNRAAVRLYERVGFRCEGDREQSIAYKGEVIPVARMTLSRKQWSGEVVS